MLSASRGKGLVALAIALATTIAPAQPEVPTISELRELLEMATAKCAEMKAFSDQFADTVTAYGVAIDNTHDPTKYDKERAAMLFQRGEVIVSELDQVHENWRGMALETQRRLQEPPTDSRVWLATTARLQLALLVSRCHYVGRDTRWLSDDIQAHTDELGERRISN